MAKVWRIVLWCALLLLAAGVVLGGVGWLTGASVPRMADTVFGGMEEAKAAAKAALAHGSETLQSLTEALPFI